MEILPSRLGQAEQLKLERLAHDIQKQAHASAVEVGRSKEEERSPGAWRGVTI